MSDNEIIDRVLLNANERGSDIIQVEYIIYTESGIRDPIVIGRGLRGFIVEGIGGKSFSGYIQ
jgi:hypothetical protein